MNGFSLASASNIYLGSTPVTAVYMGSTLIWPASTPSIDYSTEYFTIESLDDDNQISVIDSDRPSISISTDKQTWTTITPNADSTAIITLNEGEKVYIKGSNNAYYNSSWSTKGYFRSTGAFNVSGNIMSLLYGDNFQNQTTLSSSNNQAFENLFYNNNLLISAEHLVLPATTLANYCYFCMFSDCTSLTTPPELPTTTLAPSCYRRMFYNCTSLTTAPELPATTLVTSCYQAMFSGCTSLTTAPELPATTLVTSCYQSMFYHCSSLNYIKMLATNVSASKCMSTWVTGVASSGTFVKASSATLPTGNNGIPSGWTVQTV